MKINNNFNVLPFYDSLQKLNSNKWYSFGQHYPLICPNNEILPFQFIIYNEVTLYNIEAVNIETGKVTDLGVKPGITAGTQGDLTYYVVKSPGTSISEMPEGLHYLRMNTSEGYIYSEEFVFCDNYSDYIKLEYWNEDTLRFSSGEINFDDDFRFILYIPSTIGKPEYEFEEELTKRLGYKFIESQTSNKIYKFNFLAPEYICDAMRLVRMCDYIKLTTKYDTYNALTLSYNPKWQENGDLAAVDVEFETDCIIQKLESFNRRLKESFYNALLADIEEPMLFSTDVVAQYYTEYTSVNYINGKLIRQLEAASKDEIKNNLGSIVLPIDNQSDTSQEAKKVFLQDVLGLVDTVSKLFKGHYDEAGNLLWIEALSNVGVNGGVTMFIDNGSMSLPSIFDALPIDGKTLVRDANGILMVSPDIDLGGGLDEAELESYLTSNNYAKKSDIPSLSDYATKNYVNDRVTELINGAPAAYDTLKEIADVLEGNVNSIGDIITVLGEKADSTELANYIPIQGYTDILGEKNFTGGLKVNGSPIVYDATNKYWKFEGDLLVTGGVTMYANEGTYTPSTIMDALSVDNTNLKVVDGVLTFVGSVGGATTMGSLTNVGSWADSVASQDRIMYQAANSSQWVAKNLSDLAVGGVTGDYLPLSGGIIRGMGDYVAVPLRVHSAYKGFSGISIGSYEDDSELLHIGYWNTLGGIRFENTRNSLGKGLAILDNGTAVYYEIDSNNNFTKNTIWHAGNDGSGSGLDADLLDGKHYSDIINGNVASATRIQAYTHDSGEKVIINGSRTDNTFPRYIYDNGWGLCLRWQEGNGVVHNGTIATLNDTVASATKLQTARTIFGQSFDGTGNVDGLLSINGAGILYSNGSTTCYVGSDSIPNTYISGGNVNLRYGTNIGLILNSSGNVGIGTTSPSAKLHVVGDVNVAKPSTTNQASLSFVNTSSDLWQISGRFNKNVSTENNRLNFYYYNGTTWQKVMELNTSSDMSVTGNILAGGGITMYSQKSLKNVVDERGLSLEELSAIKPTRYTWKDKRDDRLHFGGIADDVQKVLPEVVYKTHDGILTMDYGNAGFAIASSLINPVISHEARIAMLEEEVKRLREENEQLKWHIA